MKVKFTASAVCMNPLKLCSEIETLIENGITNIHIDVMDGMFVPRLGMYPEQVKCIKETFPQIEIDTHLLVKSPEKYIDVFKESDTIIVHQESTYDLYSSIQKIKSHGKKIGVGLNIATPISSIENIINDVDLVMLMGFSPGILNQPLYVGMYGKIQKIRNEYPSLDIMIDGGVKMDTIKPLVDVGSTYLVCGSSTIYKNENSVENNILEMKNRLGLSNV